MFYIPFIVGFQFSYQVEHPRYLVSVDITTR